MSAPEDEPQNETQDEKPKTEETSDEKSKTEEGPAKKAREVRLPNMFWALVPILCMTALMIYVFGWVADSETYDAAHLPLLYTLAFGMPGFPCVYYGSEWGEKARKEEGDPALRPCFDAPKWTELTDHIEQLSEIKKNSAALCYGSFRSVLLTNHQCIFEWC